MAFTRLLQRFSQILLDAKTHIFRWCWLCEKLQLDAIACKAEFTPGPPPRICGISPGKA
jgi:hypothetical protein